jgi:arylsulfatase A
LPRRNSSLGFARSLGLCTALAACCAALLPAPAARAQPTKKRLPNIVIIYADDLGWADLGAYGNAFHRTPNLDALAARGVKFTDAYAAAPVCSPSRAALLTGRHPARLRLTDWLPGRADAPDQKLSRPAIRPALPLAEETLAEALKRAGYATANVGKWHLGGEGFGPREQGFDLNIAGDHHGTPVSYFYPYRRGAETTPGLDGGKEGEYLTDRLTSEAEKFIERNRGRPFFLYLPHYAVHIPMKAKPETVARYAGAARPGAARHNAVYAAMLDSLDEGVGRVLRKLEELGLRENTVVIFTSDNGGLHVEEGPNTPATSNAPLREGKGYLYEGGIRVPLVAEWPGGGWAGGVRAEPVSSLDLFATVRELAGLGPAGRADGVSLLPLLRGGRLSPPRRALYWHYPHYSNQGGKPGGAVREGRYKLIEFFEDGRAELYDLSRDPGEARDLARTMPARAGALRAKLARWRMSVGAQTMTPNPNYKGAAAGASVNPKKR